MDVVSKLLMAFQSKGLIGYNRVSQSQLKVALQFVDEILAALKEVRKLGNGRIRIVDYGCSEGRNSMLTFRPVFEKFREEFGDVLDLLHTDLPGNNWQAVYDTIGTDENTYATIEKVYYSTLGRSFFQQIVPDDSVFLGYTSYALHYLSQKQPRNPGEFGWTFENGRIQGFQDIKHLLNLRIKELIPGGIFVMIINAREFQEKDPSFTRYNFDSVKRLLDKGQITENEFKHYVWHSYPYHKDELLSIFTELSDKIEVLKNEYGKIQFPYYSDYLESGNVAEFKENVVQMMRVMMKNPLYTALERDEAGKDQVFELALKEIEALIDEGVQELFQDYIFAVIRKIN